MFDILLTGGEVVDGTGSKAYKADVALQGDRIVGIGDFSEREAAQKINVQGKVVCPGFIDVHSHSELAMLAGKHTAGIQMGVTTEFTGPDGFSFAPLNSQRLAEYRQYMNGFYGDEEIDWDFKSLSDYLKRFNGKVYNNVAIQVPHAVLRLAVKGWEKGPVNEAELKEMQRVTAEFMQAGAVGINAGLDYVPASQSDLNELVGISRAAAPYGGVFSAHMRGYGDLERAASINELITINRETGLGVHISHFFGDERIYKEMDEAYAQGVDISFDAYCYRAGCTSLTIVFPRTLMDCTVIEFMERLKKPETRRIASQSVETFFPEDSRAYFAYLKSEKNKWMEGKTVREVWAKSGKSFGDFVCDLLIEEDLSMLLIYPWDDPLEFQEKKMKHTLTHPLQMYITDGIYLGSSPHPRGWGTYPKVLREIVREKQWITLEDAVRRMTSYPAQRYGLKDRGVVKEGYAADLVVFDPLTVSDQATFAEPKLPPVGIEHVFVNGVPVVLESKLLETRPGTVLKK